jgi:thiamine-monophosphate kinase
VREALWLAGTGALRALIDLSDGLGGDAAHLAAASDCRVDLWAASIPLAPGLADAAGEPAALDFALRGGEDYELCLAVVPGELAPRRAEFEARFGVPLTCVGTVREGQGVFLDRADGSTAGLADGGFDHFGPA